MKPVQAKQIAAAAIPVVAVVGFIEDIRTRQGVDHWVWYLFALVLTIFLGRRLVPLVLAGVFSALTLVGYELSPPGSEAGLAFLNRSLGIGVLWVVGLLIFLREQREAALRQSEERYRRLFENMQEGFAYCRMIYEGDKAQDFIYLEVNRAFGEIIGLKNVLGKRVTEVIPGIKETHPELFEIYGRVALTGEPEEFEFHLENLDLWLNISVYSMTKGTFVATFEDITKRKQAYEEVRKLSCAVEQSPVSVVITDKAARIEYVNAKFCEVTGYSAEEARGKNPRVLKSGEMSPEHYKELWAAITSGKTWRGEFHNRKKNGELFWELSAISPVLNAEGKITAFLAIKEDITEQKRTQKELLWKTAFLEAQVDSSPDGVLVVDTQARISLRNKRFLELFKVPVDLAGNDDDAAMLQWAAGRVRNPRQFIERVEYLFARPDETGRDEIALMDGTILDRCSAPVRDETGKYYGRIWTFRDITQSRRAEERVREQAALLDKASDAIWVIDSNMCIRYWNKGAEVLYGWTAAEAIGKNPVDLLYGGTVTPQLQQCIDAINERGEWAGELEEVTKDGKTVIVQGRSNLIYDEQGQKKGTLIIATDMTERKKLEAQFLRAQRMESIGTLAGGIAHDLNNVLAPIMMSVQLLKEMVPDKDAHQLLDAMENNVHRGAGLVKQVLTFGRGLAGQRIPVPPRRFVREIEQIIQESFPKSVEFESRLPADLWTVNGDATQLHQILLNLCVNARDAMPGGGKLSIEAANVDLDKIHSAKIPGSKPGSYVVFKVADTGTGMSQEIQDRMFEPFFTTKGPGKGTGLGLSTTLGIVKSHGGFINCVSEIGKGSTFEFYIPANPTLVQENTAVGAFKIPRGHNELVLLVDDEESIRRTAAKMLEHFGYRVLLAANGAEALSLYASRQREIAVVITDASMPVMDGSTAITAIKSINPEVKIISSSGMPANADKSPATGILSEHFVAKPYSADTLLHKLHEVLNGAAASAAPSPAAQAAIVRNIG